ncbi:class I adenylate-forming enzyme family protein [Hyphobacterium sp.]|uniref:class I adenylate-forming enzyme family protein n=1 Tax=Hyphobacterium sp. TaxID=2004662 RepID=UPI003BA8B4D0
MADRLPAPTRDEIMESALKLMGTNPFFEVGEAEIRGATFRVFKNAPNNTDGLLFMCDMHADKIAVVHGDVRWTFGDLAREARSFAAGLVKLGVKKGDMVATATRNTPEWMATYLGTTLTGAVIVPLNGWWTPSEMEFALKDCGAKILLVDSEQSPKFLTLKDKLGLKLICGTGEFDGQDRSWASVRDDGLNEDPPAGAVEADDLMSIMYTSGSTGDPKGVMLTHRGAWSVILSFAFVMAAAKETEKGGKMAEAAGDLAILLSVPLFHVTGTHPVFMLSIILGRKMVLMRAWKPEEAVRLIKEEKITNFVGVPTMSHELMLAAEAMGESLDTLTDLSAGGAKRPASHVKRLAESFKSSYSSTGYGLSETSALGTYNGLLDYQSKPGSCGRAVPPLTDVRIVGSDGKDVSTGEPGEVWIKTPGVFAGYLNLPEETEKALTPDGWFKSGDVGTMDEEGFVTIVDRLKDMIVRGGENVACLEVEAALVKHPRIIEAAVFAVPDARLGEAVGAAIYTKPGIDITLDELNDFLEGDLAAFKRPEHLWHFNEPLPRGGTEKVDKPGLRKQLLGGNA